MSGDIENDILITKTNTLTSNTEHDHSHHHDHAETNENIDDEMEQEEMFVEPDHPSLLEFGKEWGGPRRGGRFQEPTRFGDWERKCRCTDF